jgi:LysR family nitrogen assimilation transcriptional regulator
MNLKALRYFLKVSEVGSESGAAKALHIAQPALSAQIRKLESDLGVQLFHRSSRGMTVAEAGKRLAVHAQVILEGVERAEEEMLSIGERPRGNVTVGFGAPVSNMLAIPLLEIMKERYQNISLHIIETMSGFLREWLDTGRLDMAVLYNVENHDGMLCESLLREPLYLIAPPGSNFARESISFSSLSDIPLILPSRLHDLRLVVENQAKKEGFNLDIVFEIDAAPQILKLVERRMGHSVLSRMMVQDQLSRGQLLAIPIVNPSISRSVVLVRSAHWTRAAGVVHGEITALVADLVKAGRWESAEVPTAHNNLA